jgi:hypothetical protein
VAIGTFFLAGLLFDDQQEKMADPGHGPKLDPFMGELLTTAAGKFGDDIVDSELGVRLSVTDFHEEPVQKRLTAELRKGLSFWLDFPAISNRLGVERLSLAFKSAGIAVLVDPAAQASLTKKQQKLRYALYAENVAHDEVTAILHHIHKAELGTPAARTFDQLVLTSINADKRAVLAKAMRVDPKHIDPGFKVPDLPAMIELPKGAPAKIANQAKVPERLALLVALEGDGRAVDSPQFRQFWDARQGFLPGTVQIVLVIREQST